MLLQEICQECDSNDIYDGQCMSCGNFLDGVNYVTIIKCENRSALITKLAEILKDNQSEFNK